MVRRKASAMAFGHHGVSGRMPRQLHRQRWRSLCRHKKAALETPL
jgi:hypothetical protein